ncbi:ABC transporter substrate-binding protein [Pelagibacterium montanilacus]|uniref:ABC transporter substrate-binding protein n=1 Tax=Pelagibacterium montanilacus TaxID=2185280 RepID=UPI000F8E758C|nr:substrate-binding domain-containing protein [Pelagibacterium montanilacus]
MVLKQMLYSTAVAGLLTAPAIAQDLDAMSVDDLLPLAQQEGTVTVYSFTSRIASVEAAFEEAYPGIDMIGFDMSSTEQITRIRAESDAGISNVDVVYISDAPVVVTELLEAGLIANYVPPRMDGRLDDEFTSPLLAQRLSTKVLMYNEEANPDGAPVDNLWALTTEDWTGRVVMVDPLQRGDYLDLMTEIVLQSDAMAEAYEAQFGEAIALDADAQNAGEQFIIDLFANDVILVSSTDDVNAAVGATGQDNPPVGFTSYSDRRDNEDEGWALQVANDVAPSNGIIFPALIGLATNPANPAAARLAIDFLMGDDSETGGPGFAPFAVPGDYATRNDITNHPDAVALDEFIAWRIDPVASAEIRQDVADLILVLQ